MIRCVLIDDEVNSLEMMEWLFKTYCPEVKIEEMCNSAEKGIEAINKHKPDVVFLDIEMPHMNGFDLLEKFDRLFNVQNGRGIYLEDEDFRVLSQALRPSRAGLLQHRSREDAGEARHFPWGERGFNKGNPSLMA